MPVMELVLILVLFFNAYVGNEPIEDYKIFTNAILLILQQKISNILKTLELRNNNIAQHH